MEKVKPVVLYVYHKITDPAIRLELYKGIATETKEECGKTITFKGYRWMIKGKPNPFPISNGTWFVGLPPKEMEKHFFKAGYILTDDIGIAGL